ncbi:fibronectin type III domain-containing protein [Hymenobacter persicinus]|uniref:T9SS type A sorting domain-containing protein n=1 Tax=Hymenobacter persicinus TaxID=2025506 RepID=A0A4Q5LC57_9BACT|nr:fibronectin type III domain-containing protein [Hymenobacter persicinus]RYU78761.1 T9SS type A sorting domain-containing protein [Hymenobacter persicinus]
MMKKSLLTSTGRAQCLPILTPGRWRTLGVLLLSLWLGLQSAAAQVDTYTFSSRQDTFTPLSGATPITGMNADSYLSPAIGLGFTFVFDGTPYTSVKASSDGYLTFGTATSTSLTNALATTAAGNRPLVAPLWDDMDGRPAGATASGSYLVQGTAPNRVFVFEWLNWEWNYNATGPVISFQAKLYEGTNKIEFFYRGESAPVNSGSASIGIAGVGTGAGSYLSLNNTSATPSASSTTETTTLNTKPADGQVYTFAPAPPAACPAPRNLTATNLTATTADLTWTVSGGGGTFRIEYGLQGFTLGQGMTVTSSTPAVTLTNLTTNTGYQFYVTQLCGGTNGSSTTSGPVAFTTRVTAPANDACTTAVSLTPAAINAACTNATSGTLEGATATPGLATPVGTADDDVWYSFVATSTAHTVTLTGSGDYVQQLLSGTCANLTSVGYSDPNVKLYSGLTVGTTYYVRVYSYSATLPTPAAAAFTICVTTPTPPPTNDDPCGAIQVPITADCVSPTQGSNINATTTTVNGYTNPGCGIASTPIDVWFKFTTPATGPSSQAAFITVTGTVAGQLRVFSAATCAGPFTQIGCKAGTTNNTSAGTLEVSGLSPNTTYYVFVSGYGSGDATGTFTICVTPPDACSAPRNLATTNLTATSATLNWVVSSGSNVFTINYGLAGFTPGTQGTTVTSNTTSLNVTNLTPNTAYEFYVTQNCGGTSGNSTRTGPFAFQTLALPPANDECTTATTLPVPRGASCVTSLIGTNVGATGSTGASTPTCSSDLGGDVWYSLTVPSNGIVTIETDSVGGSPVTDTGIAVYSGSCGTLTQVGCDDDSSPNGLFSLLRLTGQTPGSTLYVRVFEYGNNAFGRFRICAHTPSDCPEPTGLTATGITATTATLGWTTPGGGGTFTVDYGPQGFVPGSAAGTRVTGITGTSLPLTGLNPTTAYQFYVTQVCGGTTGNSTPVGPFNFSTTPVNDNPTGAIALTLVTECTNPQTGTNGGASTTSPVGYANPGTGCGTTTTPRDVWFRFTTLASGRGSGEATLTVTGAASMVRVFSAPSNAGPFTQVGCSASATSGAAPSLTIRTLTPSTTYYVMVANARTTDALGAFTICLTAPSDCPVPAGLTTTSISATSASLIWSVTAPAPSGTFDLEYGPQGFTLGQGTKVSNLTTNTATITGLTADTDYCFYVRQSCGGTSGNSAYTGPACFRTALAPATNDEPCNAIVLPTTGVPLSVNNLGATTTTPNGYVNPGCTTSNNPKDVWFKFTTPAGATGTTASFTTTGNPAGQARVFSAASCSGPFTQVACKASAGNNQTVGTFSVPGLQPNTTYYMMVAGYGSNDGTGAFTVAASFITAARTELPGGEVSVFPNPSNTGQVTLQLRGATGASAVTAELFNTLGQQVRRQQLPLAGGALDAPLAVQGLSHGVYTLRLQVGDYIITRKLVLE